MLLIFAKLHIFFDILQRKRLKFSKNAKQSDELAAFPLICSNFTKIITALGITKLKNEFFILFFTHLALILDKLRLHSGKTIKQACRFFHSFVVILDKLRLHSGKTIKQACCFFHSFVVILDKLGCGSEEQTKNRDFYFVFHSPCTNFVEQR